MNEHELQSRLTRTWVRDGIRLGGERLFLAAWEVMDDYRINSAKRSFGRPAIDFLLLDRAGRLVAVELKMKVQAPRDCWAVLCQVTHRAHLLAAAFDTDRLVSASQACRTGQRGRVETTQDIEDLRTAHSRFFGIRALATLPGLPIRRVVAAPAFGAPWPSIRDRFVAGPPESLARELARYSYRGGAGLEFRRFLSIPPALTGQVDPAVMTLNVPMPN